MIKVLIVDDEPLVQVGVKSILNWQELNMEVCGTASNGQAALKIIEEQSPDIVITDIKMPVMTGLELVKVCTERYGKDNPCFIILTSYEDFHMVKEALSYQVSDYLLKLEMDADTLTEALQKAVKRLPGKEVSQDFSTEVHLYHEKFFIRLLHNLFESDNQFLLQAKELGVSFIHAGFVCCYGEIIDNQNDLLTIEKQMSLFSSTLQMIRELVVKYLPCHCVSLDVRHFALIFCYDELPASTDGLLPILGNISDTLSNYYNVSIRCGIGNIVEGHQGISSSYQYARQAFRQASEASPFVCIDSSEIDSNVHSSFNISVFKSDLTRAFEEYDAELLDKTICAITELFESHPDHYLQAIDAASNILHLAISLLPDVESLYQDSSDGYRSLYTQNSVEQIMAWLSAFSANICSMFEEHKKDYKNHIVAQVKKHINAHVRERLSLNEVAAVFAISPSYLSQLFSKYNDCGFVEYVNNCKIKEAKKLLDDSTLKVYEIAEILGFESAFYFSKVFKKVEGISPTDYLNK